jgi:alanyl-tRNA synthetase
MTSAEIRKAYIDFFVQKHGHTFVASSPVVPHDDPTLLFTNAGMNQFKPYFLGQEKAPWRRVANTQKCIRAGGKHNDLDDVGRSRRHHTFFEMLGNWSFGDYFKQGAIEMAWELVTKVFRVDPSRIHVTCYEGDEKAGIPRDTEAAEIWKKVAGLPDDHIHFLGKDNFWEMGETGPCGPCTEIFIDRTPGKTGGPSVVKDDDPRVMEFWNNVFIQYNRDASGKLTPLPAQHVDTGMGFERICQILQNKDDNYAIDLWDPYFAGISKLSGMKYTGQFPKSNVADPVAEAQNVQLRTDIAFRVIADHVRCLTFALTDGAVPSNEGRGYVLRRILRRAVRFGRQQLNLRDPFIHTLVPVVVETMGDVFPELKKNPTGVAEIIRDEEISFGKTIDRGISLFEEAANAALANQEQKLVISGADAFKLHDTYGFPIDLTRIMAEERGMTVDITGYEAHMEKAKEIARAGGKAGQAPVFDLPPDALGKLGASGVAATDDQLKYKEESAAGMVRAIWNGSDLVESIKDDQSVVAVILDKTNFYAEMGGQIGDAGLVFSQGGNFDVHTARSVGGYVLHIGKIRSGALKVGDSVAMRVDDARLKTEKNHTSTHLANWALREVLGDAVQQKGSLVDPEKLRFDFVHGKALTDQELEKVESLVNQAITRKLPVFAQNAPQAEALKINGLRAVFGEKYPPMVRVVSIGVPVAELLQDPGNAKWREYSIEFCGGTHLGNAYDAGAFVITSEESVSKGIRRIVALTGRAALDASANGVEIGNLVNRIKTVADGEIDNLIEAFERTIVGEISIRAKRRAQAAIAELQGRQKSLEKANKKRAGTSIDAILAAATALLDSAGDAGGAKVIIGELVGASDDQLRTAMDSLRKRAPSSAILLGSATGEDKVTFVAAVSDDVIAKGLKAGDWIRETAKVAGGGGGGRPQMAQAGGKEPAKLGEALNVAREFAKKTIK